MMDRLDIIRAAVFDVWGDGPSVDDIACAVELALKSSDRVAVSPQETETLR